MSSSLVDSLWDWSVASTYIYLATGNSNKAVGLVEGLQGFIYSISAVPAGWAADKYRRDTVLRCALWSVHAARQCVKRTHRLLQVCRLHSAGQRCSHRLCCGGARLHGGWHLLSGQLNAVQRVLKLSSGCSL